MIALQIAIAHFSNRQAHENISENYYHTMDKCLGGKLLLIFLELRILKISYWTSTKMISPKIHVYSEFVVMIEA